MVGQASRHKKNLGFPQPFPMVIIPITLLVKSISPLNRILSICCWSRRWMIHHCCPTKSSWNCFYHSFVGEMLIESHQVAISLKTWLTLWLFVTWPWNMVHGNTWCFSPKTSEYWIHHSILEGRDSNSPSVNHQVWHDKIPRESPSEAWSATMICSKPVFNPVYENIIIMI